MSDKFEQWFESEFPDADLSQRETLKGYNNLKYGWNAALSSLQGEAVAKIAELEARIKELEQQLVCANQLSVHDIRIGMAAMLQCDTSEIETMDIREYGDSYRAVKRVVEAISLTIKQDKLFGSEIYQAAANHYDKQIKELEAKLAEQARLLGISAERELALQAKLADLEEMVDDLLAHCDNPECLTCGEIVCPHKEPLHFHHDGCPACAQYDAIQESKKGGAA